MSYGDDYEGGRGRTATAPRPPQTPELQTRKPTGNVTFPFILVEGEPKGGKSYALAALSNSPRVGRTFILELGDPTMDEYAPLGPFDLLVHDGTFTAMRDQIRAATAVPMEDGKPNVIGIDSGSHLWGLLKDWTDSRAKRSNKGQAILRNDPDAEVDASMNLWNDAKDRWHDIMDALQAWPGIAVVTARGAEKAKVENGVPVANQTEYTVEAEKTLVFDVSAQVRFERGRKPRLVAVRSLFIDVPPGGFELPRENTLDHLIFEVLSGGKSFAPSQAVLPQLGVSVATAKMRVLHAIQRANPNLGEAEAKEEAARLWKATMPNEPKEVPEAVLAAILAQVGAPPDPDGPAAQAVPQAPRNGNGDQAPRQVSADEVIRKIRGMSKRDLVAELQKQDPPLSTSGRSEVLQDRLIHALGLDEAPFDPGPPKATAETAQSDGVEEEPQADEDPGSGGMMLGPDLPLDPEATGDEDDTLREVPEGWREDKCFCMGAIMYEPGNVSATVRHLDPKMDEDHPADPIF